MRAKLYFKHGSETDSMILEADTLEELRELGAREVERRNPDYYWSELYDGPEEG